MARMIGAVLAALVFAGVALSLAYLMQRRILFPVPPGPRGSAPAGTEVVRLSLTFGVVEALLLTPAGEHTGPRPLLLFAHGNGELADFWIDEFGPPRAAGWAVLLLEYPGYGRSAGTPSESTVSAVARAAHDWAVSTPRIDGAHIVAYGRSLGGAVAARLAADRQLPGLILESAFTSVRPLAAGFFLPSFLVRDPFDTLAAATGYRGRALVLHGRDDEIVPVAHGRELAAAAGAVFHELPCGHNDCPRAWEHIEPFLASLVLP